MSLRELLATYRLAYGRCYWLLVVPLCAALTVLGSFAVVFGREAQSEALMARAAITQAEAAIGRGDADSALSALDDASAHLEMAAAAADAWSLSMLSPLPVVGSPGNGLSAAADAGAEVVAAGRVMAETVESATGENGGFNLDLSALHDTARTSEATFRRTHEHLVSARRLLEGPAGAVLPPVSKAARALLAKVETITTRVSKAEQALALAGRVTAPGTSLRLLVLAQDSLELRPTGGLIGSFGILQIVDGKAQLEHYADAGALPYPVPEMEPPPELAPYLNYPWNLVNANWSPDFPTTARTAAELLRRQGGGEIDGVIGMTEATIGRLLNAIGPIKLPEYDKPVTGRNLSQRILYETTLKRPLDEPRKKFLIQLAHELFGRLFATPADRMPAILEALGASAVAGDLQMWFENPEWQGLLDPTITGALPAPGGDFLLLAEANMSGGKANAELVRHVGYDVTDNGDGRLRARLEIRYRNSGAESRINPYYNGLVRVYVPQGAQLISGGKTFPAPDGPYTVMMEDVYVPPDGGTDTVIFEYILPASVVREGRYRLTWLRQPGTSRDSYFARVGDRTFESRAGLRRLSVEVGVG